MQVASTTVRVPAFSTGNFSIGHSALRSIHLGAPKRGQSVIAQLQAAYADLKD